MAQEYFDPDGVGVDNGNYFSMPFTPEEAALVLLSAPWDVTVSYGAGAAYAPDAIIGASTQLDFYDPDCPNIWQRGIATADVDYSIQDRSARLRAIAKRIIEKADKYGVALNQLHIDPCVMALATKADAMDDFVYCIQKIHEFAPEVKVTGAISNISFEMPARKFVNNGCLAYALEAGLDSGILDPCNEDMLGTIYACEALRMTDKGGRKYNRAYRKGLFGQKK